jgi:hypothetical protein
MSCAVLGDGYYSAEPIEAWVVDQQTKKPLEGVVIVAQWKLMSGTVGGRVPVGTMMILETMTDAKGRFSFPAWGPLANTSDGYLDYEDPEIFFFKPGYFSGSLSNHYAVPYSDKPSRRKSDWNGRTIDLRLFPGTMDEYALHVGSSSRSLLSNPNPNVTMDCYFMKTPLLAEAIDREMRSLEARGYRKGGFMFSRLLPEYAAKCDVARSSGEK